MSEPQPTKLTHQSLQQRDEALRRAATIFEQRVLPHLSPRIRALDLGTGNGHTAFTLAKHFSSVESIDIDSECVKRAQEKATAQNLHNINIRIMDAHALQYPDSEFDVVTCRAAIHHYTEPGKVLQQVYRVLKPGAFLVVMDFCFSPAAKAALAPLSKIRETDFARYFTFHDYCDLLETAGFTIDTIYTYTLPRVLKEWVALAPENVRDRLIDAFMALAPEVHSELRLTSDPGGCVMTYRIVELVAQKQHESATNSE
jgi:ubiquinone/menaquinone biosynthesis C-methylase UbiE